MRASKFLLLLVFFFVANLLVRAQTTKLTAAEAKSHVGESATVCGTVASTHYADKTKGQPTFLNLDKAYPNAIFTILIWGSNRPKFGRPEATYRDKDVCVTGKITAYKGIPEIIASEPSEIEIRK
jgi:hypothetical protein